MKHTHARTHLSCTGIHTQPPEYNAICTIQDEDISATFVPPPAPRIHESSKSAISRRSLQPLSKNPKDENIQRNMHGTCYKIQEYIIPYLQEPGSVVYTATRIWAGRFPARATHFSFPKCVRAGSGDHPTSYSTNTRLFPRR